MSGVPLSRAEKALWDAIQPLRGADTLLDFVARGTPGYERPEHLLPIAEIFWRAERAFASRRDELGVRALSSTPPQHAKTASMLAWLVRWMTRFPGCQVIYVSYSYDFAVSKSFEARELSQRLGLAMSHGSRRTDHWSLDNGSTFIATAPGGALTGYRADLLVIDDPHKNREEAESPTLQEKTLAWLRSTAMTRLSPRASVVVNMARWAEGDLIGRLSREGGWDVVNLPAILDEGTDRERALAPSLKPLWFLREQRRTLHAYDWASLYQGSPQPRGGAVFRGAYRYTSFDVARARYVIAADPAASDGARADHSAAVVMAATGSGADQVVYVVDVWRGRVEVPELVEVLRALQDRWACPVVVEAVAGFKSVAQLLRRVGGRRAPVKDARGRVVEGGDDPLRVVEVPARGSKFVRALPLAAAWNDGRVLLPDRDEPWVLPLLEEVSRFTGSGDREDDQVDALAHAFDALDQPAPAPRRGVGSQLSPILRAPAPVRRGVGTLPG